MTKILALHVEQAELFYGPQMVVPPGHKLPHPAAQHSTPFSSLMPQQFI